MDNSLTKLRSEMIEFVSEHYQLDGSVQSDIPNLDFFFSKTSTELINIMYEPSLCVILQGQKAIDLADETLSYNTQEYLISSTHLPAKMKILKASEDQPYMSLRIKFSLEDIYDLLKTLKPTEDKADKHAQRGLYFGEMSFELYESIYRLVMLLKRSQQDRDYLYHLLTKEILYNLVKSKGGTFLRKFAQAGSTANKITKVIAYLKENFDTKLNIKELAYSVDMSESSLYQHFKTITTMSPIQFQKNLRLEEAKQLLLLQNIEISEAAYRVGYESPSQFSREFSRMFGMSPKAFVKSVQ